MSAKLLKSITQANKWFNTIMKSTTSSSREVAAPRRGALAEAVAPLVRRGVARSARRRGKIRMPPRGAEPALPGWDHVAVKLARPAGLRSRRRDVAEEEKGSVDAARLSVPQQRVGAAVSPRGSRIKSLPYLRCVAAGAPRRARRASLGRSRHRQPPPLDAPSGRVTQTSSRTRATILKHKITVFKNTTKLRLSSTLTVGVGRVWAGRKAWRSGYLRTKAWPRQNGDGSPPSV